ncbi:MAG TPA: NADH:ubiquinone oxidoreductase [Cyanobacteria bacterium UBA11149]|nr:NADH:ubiquinone oxidoreductase [Cyanobacteria bacterium UBA11367]HBE56379.1 NADH:ubiquinone oxidoreductase [Cyanobacteria bacterium UBA11366]HBK66789.1 NADH:ubiquinone oxidoreductase [Cyanobacteria bacterium UBA11166]HBR72694.1 NADH:ubiquinone oxidoreductase [Cyanobacteria bacterium UBA11159]HBS71231.1 NADH:ubiquinone oxidoreductase [Cyanobacteria bacterium UBA11153]HBW88197.1 NADH:ubiquinone oxidoreductase [Cyanobacteria bacterium UBA11149]HCA96983.1 NADH:ubiquinone oxidoreductase [Cyanob
MKKVAKVSELRLEGHFLGFVGKSQDKPKHLELKTAMGEYCIKISKNLRRSLGGVLQPGDWIEIAGEHKYCNKTGAMKLKADWVEVKRRVALERRDRVLPPRVTVAQAQGSVMLCQKSSCRKRGAAFLGEALKESLCDRGLADQVKIKDTGCMKRCEQGPCMVFLPDKARYTKVKSKDVSMLVEKHFPAKLKPEASNPQLSGVR